MFKIKTAKMLAVFITAMFMVLGLMVSSVPKASAAASTTDPRGLGRIGYYIGVGDYTLWLGTQVPRVEGAGTPYCIQGGMTAPAPADKVTSVATLSTSTPRVPGLELTTPQAAWMLENYGEAKDSLTAAAVSLLVHANFEQGGGQLPTAGESVSFIIRTVRAHAPQIEQKAKAIRNAAVKSAAVGYQKGSYTGDGKRRGVIHSLGVTNANGEYIAGLDLTVSLSGPAKFTSTGTNTYRGKTTNQPISLNWEATGNGQVKYNLLFPNTTNNRVKILKYGAGLQQTLTRHNDPHSVSFGSPSWKVIYDFQPQGVSQVEKISDEGVFTDVFDAQADPNYGDGKWLELDADEASRYGLSAGSVPVTYKVSAYYTGVNPPATSKSVPEGAELIGSKQVVANGPGKISATFSAAKPGFATVVWEVVKNEQGKAAELIHQDWKDGYGLTQETTSYRHKVEIDSSLSIRQTKTGTYLVDDLFVEGMPDNHPSFDGSGRFKKDEAFIEQSLLFFPKGLEVSEANKDKAIEIGKSVKIPAKNGFHASIGSTSFKLRYQKNNLPEPGTYVFVSSFKGDDRVKPFQSLVTDEKEQYKVDETLPILVTTARDKTDGDKILRPIPGVSVEDKVCDINKTLIPGKKYSLLTDIVKKSDGKSVLDKPKESSFTIDKIGDCTTVELSFDGSKLKDEQVVVFQTLKNDKGETIAKHHNINDPDQTLRFGSGGGGEGLAKTGAGIGALLGASIGSIIAGNNLRRKK